MDEIQQLLTELKERGQTLEQKLKVNDCLELGLAPLTSNKVTKHYAANLAQRSLVVHSILTGQGNSLSLAELEYHRWLSKRATAVEQLKERIREVSFQASESS